MHKIQGGAFQKGVFSYIISPILTAQNIMRHSSIKNISDVLEQSSLSRLVERANLLNAANEVLRPKLPEQFRTLCRIVNLNDSELVFETPNAVVRQGLQLQQAYLLQIIQQAFPKIQTLVFRINPDFHPH